ncbi:D-glutamate cyclase family protein [Pseudorhizobium tarimense]|uniref:D-glutamate cyclase family protein n=1 Tax=Pseudorhizobium tarimense TaxID=1079109 RepID=UPI001FF67B2B|nr:DUF1445 domain-containing protein [Pseudorhizobium tarimense]MCJ8520718.1 DUF1445 domain-containing protein [Pseudorhizobium tarimense]
MYRTTVETTPAEQFSEPVVVSMRPVLPADAIREVENGSHWSRALRLMYGTRSFKLLPAALVAAKARLSKSHVKPREGLRDRRRFWRAMR